MKKTMMLVTAFTMLFVLAACGGQQAQEPAQETGTASEQTAEDAKEAEETSEQTAGEAKEVVLTATNFKFDQQEYKMAKGETVKFTLKNEQGFHGVNIKGLGVNLDNGNPSQTVTIDKPGTYEIVCSIPCGSGHANMKSVLVVE
jgi:cytochrome c oxidase subunit 2